MQYFGSYRMITRKEHGAPVFAHHGQPAAFLYFKKFDKAWVVSRRVGAAPYIFVSSHGQAMDVATVKGLEWKTADDATGGFVGGHGIESRCTTHARADSRDMKKAGVKKLAQEAKAEAEPDFVPEAVKLVPTG
eukprot:g5713.t1